MKLMKVSDYAKKVGLSVPAIYKQINANKLKTVTKYGLKLIKVKCVIFLLVSCSQQPGVIVGKSTRTFGGENLPKGLCRFSITGDRLDKTIEFIDSCHFYHIYDTIKVAK